MKKKWYPSIIASIKLKFVEPEKNKTNILAHCDIDGIQLNYIEIPDWEVW